MTRGICIRDCIRFEDLVTIQGFYTHYNMINHGNTKVLGKDFDNFVTLNADDVLFSALLLNENHVLHQLLPPLKSTRYNLRNRPHNYTLPIVNNNYIKNNFMFRMLYKTFINLT